MNLQRVYGPCVHIPDWDCTKRVSHGPNFVVHVVVQILLLRQGGRCRAGALQRRGRGRLDELEILAKAAKAEVGWIRSGPDIT